jgi:DNA-directed RNA polymerase II subunit RPB1
LVGNEELTTPSWLKIQSDPLGNFWDSSGDEMNLHMPQGLCAEVELRLLAAIPYQIISPANNAPIIGIFQDSMLGSYLISRPKLEFNLKTAMNLLVRIPNIDVNIFSNKTKNDKISNYKLLTQIMPNISLKSGDFNISNGQYLDGMLTKKVIHGESNGILHRIINDFGNLACTKFINELQAVVNEYIKTVSFSVGISDLILSKNTDEKIVNIIEDKLKEVHNLIQQVQLGIFENSSGKSNNDELESRINGILGSASTEAGKASSEYLKTYDPQNRFMIMFLAGSKGSEINIQQMTACLGQQNVDGKRIPYGYEFRTLPHFTKYDDSPEARGFVKSSYINGLTPLELFFHAMGGRIGLIDTAVKTSTTGYIQRRLIKSLEDLCVSYDYTIRNNKGCIIQYRYGGDSIDTSKVEKQSLPLVEMSIEDIYNHYGIIDNKLADSVMTNRDKDRNKLYEKCKLYANLMIEGRHILANNIFGMKSEDSIRSPVAFKYIIQNIIGSQHVNPNFRTELSMLEAYTMIEKGYERLCSYYYAKPTILLELLYFYYLSPKDLIINKRFTKESLSLLIETIILQYEKSLVNAGEMVGIVAAQSIGEPTTQMTLNTFHFAGVGSKSNVTTGVPRIEEILMLTSNIKSPSLTIYLKEEDQTNREKASLYQYMIEHTKLKELVKIAQICFDPSDTSTEIVQDKLLLEQYNDFEQFMEDCIPNEKNINGEQKSKWLIRLELNPEIMLEKNITMDDVYLTLKSIYGDEISCVYSDYNSDNLVFRIRVSNILKNASMKGKKNKSMSLDPTDQIYMLKNFQDQMINSVILRGIDGIDKVNVFKMVGQLTYKSGSYVKEDIWCLDTTGTNLLSVLALDYIDATRTISNDIIEIYNVLGIDAARQTIYNELMAVLSFDGGYVNSHHLSLLADRMTYTYKLITIYRHGINNDDIGPIAKASFEETTEVLFKAARHGEVDFMKGISANVMCGQEGSFGTSSFKVLLDMNMLSEMETAKKMELRNEREMIDDAIFGNIENPTDKCSLQTLKMNSNVDNIKVENTGHLMDEYDIF